VHRPQNHWFRKVVYQVHLWTGIAVGLYVLVVCISGSAAVFNRELYTAFAPDPKYVAIVGTRMNPAQLRAAAQVAYPAAFIGRIVVYRNPSAAAMVTLGTSTNAKQRFLDPYTGKDVGDARPLGLRMVSYTSQLHMNLMMDYRGRIMNGVGGFIVSVLSLTGMVIWWPGVERWRRSLTIRFNASPKRLNWDLHSAVGFWTFTIVFMWALTGAYLVFPRWFDLLTHHHINFDQIIHEVHVGNFAGWPVKALWVILGLTPPLLFVTGFLMWWERVLRPWLARPAAQVAHTVASSQGHPSITVEP
jgi:uncharacterized iron-regulated membrane protein